MYWTNANGSETPAFSVVFAGTDTGAVEILEEDTVHDGKFRLDGDQISFTFTRIFDLPTGDWPEKSEFKGTLVGLGESDGDEIYGDWFREGWSCEPDRDPPCGYEPVPTRFAFRLTRQS